MNLLGCQICRVLSRNVKSFLLGLIIYKVSQVLTTKAEFYTSQSFGVILTSSYPHFVMFYVPWCGHCKRVQTIWDKFAVENHVKRRMKVAKVDCTAHTPICAAENIKAYPSFILYSDQRKYHYRGNRDLEEFNKFVTTVVSGLKDGLVPAESDQTTKDADISSDDAIPVSPVKLTKETFRKEIDDDFTFVDFFAPWCSHCVKLEPTWNKLADAMKYNMKIKIAQVDCTVDSELCQEQKINGYPTLNLYKDGYLVEGDIQARSLSNLVSFVQSSLAKDELIVNHPPEEEDEPESKAEENDDSGLKSEEEEELKLNEDTYSVAKDELIVNHPPEEEDEPESKAEENDDSGLKSEEEEELKLNEDTYSLAKDELIVNHPPEEEDEPESKAEENDDSGLKSEEEEELKLNEDTYKGLMSRTPHLIYFHNSGPEFSNMDLIIFEQVQHRLRLMNSNVIAAVIDCSKINMLCTELGIHVYPSILYFTSIAEYSQYFGLIDVEKLVEFVLQQRNSQGKSERDEL